MELHFYHEGSQTVTVRDPMNAVVYSVHSPKSHFSKIPIRIYRDADPSPPNHLEFATISKSRHWHSEWVIKYEEQNIMIFRHHFTSKSRFIFGDREFEWRGDKELMDLKRGEIIASFKRRKSDIGAESSCGTEKIGTMVISNAGVGIVDVVVLTGIAMQRRWEKEVDRRLGRRKWGLRSMR
jgi:hypothetical protein